MLRFLDELYQETVIYQRMVHAIENTLIKEARSLPDKRQIIMDIAIWRSEYKASLQRLFDACYKLQRDLKNQGVVRFIHVAKIERLALERLRDLHSKMP